MLVLFVLSCALVMFIYERSCPATPLPDRRHWWARATLLNACQIGCALLSAITITFWLKVDTVISLHALPIWIQASAGYCLITFVYYWWHRARHEVPALWRVFHQVHHSPARLEVITSFYKHPLEIVVNSVLSSALLHLILGLSPAAVTVTIGITGVAELFYHWNVPTPYWLGFFFQRPESHREHHRRHWHRSNYSDLPLWDMLFGTFFNPKITPEKVGFLAHQESRLGTMLLAGDVTRDQSHVNSGVTQ